MFDTRIFSRHHSVSKAKQEAILVTERTKQKLKRVRAKRLRQEHFNQTVYFLFFSKRKLKSRKRKIFLSLISVTFLTDPFLKIANNFG